MFFNEFLNKVPEVQYYPEYDLTGEFEGIKAITYTGADYQGKKTRIFANIAFPESKEPVPAVVVVHGGGGHPEAKWIKNWVDRGYAVIAMSTTGHFPNKPGGYYHECFACDFEYGLTPPFCEDGYCASPGMNVNDKDLALEDQWFYHAVSQIILAHNILKNDARVDSSKIGITGISWGGILTSLALAFDKRYAFAIPIYGSAYLSESLSYMYHTFNLPHNSRWLAEKYYYDLKTPIMWLCWNDDTHFSINCNSHSYLATSCQNPSTRLSMIDCMGHSHGCGYAPIESYWFADMIINGKNIPEVFASYTEDSVNYGCSVEVDSIKLFYVNENITYVKRDKHGVHTDFMRDDWKFVELDKNATSAPLPQNAVGKYIEFKLNGGIVLTTPYVEYRPNF